MIKGYILKFELKQLFLEKRRRRIETNIVAVLFGVNIEDPGSFLRTI